MVLQHKRHQRDIFILLLLFNSLSPELCSIEAAVLTKNESSSANQWYGGFQTHRNQVGNESGQTLVQFHNSEQNESFFQQYYQSNSTFRLALTTKLVYGRSLPLRRVPAASKIQDSNNEAKLKSSKAAVDDLILLGSRKDARSLSSTSEHDPPVSLSRARSESRNVQTVKGTSGSQSLAEICSAIQSSLSCVGRCGLKPQQMPSGEISQCGCDKTCLIYGDCCDDFATLCSPLNLQEVQTQPKHSFVAAHSDCFFKTRVITSCGEDPSGQAQGLDPTSTSTVYSTGSTTPLSRQDLLRHPSVSSSRPFRFIHLFEKKDYLKRFVVADESQGLLFAHEAVEDSCASHVSNLSHIPLIVYVTCEYPVVDLSMLKITKCFVQNVVPIPESIKRPCCSLETIVCDSNTSHDLKLICQVLKTSNISLDIEDNENCRVIDECEKNMFFFTPSNKSIKVTIVPEDTKSRVEFSGLIQKSLICSTSDPFLDLNQCNLESCREGAILLIDSLQVAKDASLFNAEKGWIGSNKGNEKKRCLDVRGITMKFMDRNYKIYNMPSSSCVCFRANAAFGNLGIWNAMTMPGETCIISLNEDTNKPENQNVKLYRKNSLYFNVQQQIYSFADLERQYKTASRICVGSGASNFSQAETILLVMACFLLDPIYHDVNQDTEICVSLPTETKPLLKRSTFSHSDAVNRMSPMHALGFFTPFLSDAQRIVLTTILNRFLFLVLNFKV